MIWVKLSAPYESSVQPIADDSRVHADVTALIEHLVDNHAERLLWATNRPHPGRIATPSAATLRKQRSHWLTPELRDQVLVANPGPSVLHLIESSPDRVHTGPRKRAHT